MKIRKLFILVTAVMLCLASVGPASAAAKKTPKPAERSIKVLYNARQIDSDVQPEIKNDVVFVPFRAVANALGAQLDVTPDWKTITFTRGDRKVTITIGSKTAYVNGQKKELLVAPYATKGRTMVPTRFVSEQLGETVEWDAVSRYVWIGNKDVPKQEEVGEKRSFDEFLPMYGKRLDLIDRYDFQKDDVYVFTRQQLPIRLVGEFTDTIIYSVWEDVQDGIPVIKVHYKGKHFGLYFLTDSNYPRYRTNVEAWRVKNPDGSFVGSFPLQDEWDEIWHGIKGWDKFDYSDVRYIGFAMGPYNMPLLKYD